MERALPNIEHFYNLVVYMLKHDEIDLSVADNLIQTFENKNKLALKNSEMEAELKNEKLEIFKKGRTQINLFYRTKSMNEIKNSTK